MAVIEQALTFKDPEGHTVSGVLASSPSTTDRVAILCHGFLSNKNSTTNKTLSTLLLEREIAAFRFDFFGQGESEGPFEQITVSLAVKQALAALNLVASKGYRRIGLVGSSFGGLVALLTAAERPPLSYLALKCPVPDFPEMLEREFGKQGMAEWKTTGTIPDVAGGQGRVKLQYGFYEDCARHLGYDAAKIITAPTLIVQGDRDEYVPLHQSRRLYGALQSEKRLEILAGADHRFTRPEDFRRMTTMLADWMIQHLPAKRL
ncbi:MAG: alpha/beta hydrolase family protein [Nitrospiraceae bacterium]